MIGGESSGNVVEGNLIGTNAAGSAALGNGGDGVLVKDAYRGGTGRTGVSIGGTTPGSGNVVSVNGGRGVHLAVEDGGDIVQGNRIGTDASGTFTLGNGQGGINLVSVATPVTIGGANLAGSSDPASDGLFLDSGTSHDSIGGTATINVGGVTYDLTISTGPGERTLVTIPKRIVGKLAPGRSLKVNLGFGNPSKARTSTSRAFFSTRTAFDARHYREF